MWHARSEYGFVLIEVLAAMVIASMVVLAGLHLFSLSARISARADQETRARPLAVLLVTGALESKTPDRSLSWSLSVQPLSGARVQRTLHMERNGSTLLSLTATLPAWEVLQP